MSCSKLIFNGIGVSQFARFHERLASAGAEIAIGAGSGGASGFVKISECHFSFSYDEGMQQLLVQCLAKPFLVPCSTIEQIVREYVAAPAP